MEIPRFGIRSLHMPSAASRPLFSMGAAPRSPVGKEAHAVAQAAVSGDQHRLLHQVGAAAVVEEARQVACAGGSGAGGEGGKPLL